MAWKKCELKLIDCTGKGDMIIVILMRRHRRYIACVKCVDRIKTESNIEVKIEDDIRNISKEIYLCQ